MIYQMECDRCGKNTEMHCHLVEHETLIKPGWPCQCGGRVRQVLVNSGIAFAREAFPKGEWEHVADDPVFIRDKAHLKDVCEEHGNISKFVEDDM